MWSVALALLVGAVGVVEALLKASMRAVKVPNRKSMAVTLFRNLIFKWPTCLMIDSKAEFSPQSSQPESAVSVHLRAKLFLSNLKIRWKARKALRMILFHLRSPGALTHIEKPLCD